LKRRDFITLLGGAAAWPLAARAQQPKMPVIGLLNGASFDAFSDRVAAIRRGLRDTGFVEGQNVTIEYRSADGQYDRLPGLAADLVRRQVAVIVSIGATASPQAAKAATSNIPIVFATGGDALVTGIVKNFSRPEANVTGLSFNQTGLVPKRVELMRELLPASTVVAYLANPSNRNDINVDELRRQPARSESKLCS
jgi:putative ABC transport system substrate-binding protein